MKPSVGRIVHYRETRSDACQAALVVQTWDFDPNGPLNLVVFRDGSNDVQQQGLSGELIVWKTSVAHESEAPPENPAWHWPERVEG